MRDNDGPAGTIGTEMAGIAVQKWLIDPVKIDNTEFITHEIEEAPRSVERLPNTAGRKYIAVTRQIDVQPGIKKFAQRLADARILDRPELHGDMTATGALAKHGRAEIPARITVAR